MTTLAVFEAAARSASFKQAADELNVTTGAVSRQIKALEDELGVRLFQRDKSGVNLTPPGQDLFSEVAASFARCADAIRAVKSERAFESVTFACTDAFATAWLMPRMPDFWTRYPGVSINYFVSDTVRDFRNTQIDLFIRPATGAWPNEETHPLFEDLIYPVAGPRFAELHDPITADRLKDLPLLHMDWTNPDWPLWQDFFQAMSVSFHALRGVRFSKYVLMLSAAEADQGIALGWHSLVHPLIQQGKLLRVTTLSMRDPIGFCIAWNRKKPLSNAANLFKSWLIEQAMKLPKPVELQRS
ncbi:LysR substrate-binding domain-containing protein [Mesorhizobium sp. B2-7-3]|uniref:LysR substrate-binding domain-containing protein n=1 Tax=Mesorhizobium sp. B2-7-3 TaxID=2589907 RepID=UPI00248491C1|nr:LysR substrate-binding domain-containing protein [Mesorhizobium sp. B2-7-3]